MEVKLKKDESDEAIITEAKANYHRLIKDKIDIDGSRTLEFEPDSLARMDALEKDIKAIKETLKI